MHKKRLIYSLLILLIIFVIFFALALRAQILGITTFQLNIPYENIIITFFSIAGIIFTVKEIIRI